MHDRLAVFLVGYMFLFLEIYFFFFFYLDTDNLQGSREREGSSLIPCYHPLHPVHEDSGIKFEVFLLRWLPLIFNCSACIYRTVDEIYPLLGISDEFKLRRTITGIAGTQINQVSSPGLVLILHQDKLTTLYRCDSVT